MSEPEPKQEPNSIPESGFCPECIRQNPDFPGDDPEYYKRDLRGHYRRMHPGVAYETIR